ncbi:hypothetical protein PG999_004371 [Apiospora kogelbergensis]|uniref:CYTH domain-containing protein n=1 Tax=Apiospora kogelbergensis TaxID=1337665 RepID=A0AAW0QZ19_9PEZI
MPPIFFFFLPPRETRFHIIKQGPCKATTHDIYYDRDGLLFSKGVYVRRRDGRWEAKIRAGGDYINSAFMEIDGIQAVERAVKNIMVLPGFRSDLEEMLVPCADFVTDRESWMIDGKFKVDVDSTDFGHIVGEVELTRILEHGMGRQDEEAREMLAILKETMNQDIEAFMLCYPQIFPVGRAVGKLSAYFHRFGGQKD